MQRSCSVSSSHISMIRVNRPNPEIQKEVGTRQEIAAAIKSSPSLSVISTGVVDVVSEFAGCKF